LGGASKAAMRLSVTVRLSRRKDANKRQKQLQRRAAEADEAVVAVKGLGLLVFGVDGDRKDRKFGSRSAGHGIP
jgi:hypothetical protein